MNSLFDLFNVKCRNYTIVLFHLFILPKLQIRFFYTAPSSGKGSMKNINDVETHLKVNNLVLANTYIFQLPMNISEYSSLYLAFLKQRERDNPNTSVLGSSPPTLASLVVTLYCIYLFVNN